MRTFRIALGLAAAACAFGILVSPALAKKTHTKPPRVLGKFVANYPNHKAITETSPAMVKGVGSEELIELGEGAVTIGNEKCQKVRSAGEVDAERSDTLYERVTFAKCAGRANVGTAKHVFEKIKIPKFSIAFEFHSNGFVEGGEGENTSVHISPTSVSFATRKDSPCTIVIPAQDLPAKAARKPENEFEATSYETEQVPAKIKKFPTGFEEQLDITMEFHKVHTEIHATPGCEPEPGFDGKKGIIDAELEELKIRNGNLGFRDKQEVEEEEKA